MKIVNFDEILKFYNLENIDGHSMFQGKRIELLRSYYLIDSRENYFNYIQIEGLDN